MWSFLVTSKAWGYSTHIDLKHCNPATIRSSLKIQEFTIALVSLLKMTPYGEPTLVRFGKDPKVTGYSLVQLIETSCITAHFAEDTNSIYLDIFSCKDYDSVEACEFTKKFFEAESYTSQRLDRI